MSKKLKDIIIRAENEISQRNYAKAQDIYDQAFKMNDKNPTLLFSYANFLFYKPDLNLAEKYLQMHSELAEYDSSNIPWYVTDLKRVIEGYQ